MQLPRTVRATALAVLILIAGLAQARAQGVGFGSTSYAVPNGSSSFTIVVVRNGDPSGALDIQYAATAGTAIPGVDFNPVNGTLSWGAGDTTTRSFVVPILNNPQSPGTRTVLLTLAQTGFANASSTLTITTPFAATITSPPSGLTVVSGSPLPFAAVVSDTAGNVTQVQFLVNGVVAGTTSGTGPFTVDAIAPAPGSYKIEVVARDDQGKTASSTSTVNVVAADTTNPAPFSSILTDLNGRTFPTSSTIVISTSGSDSSGAALSRVDLYANGVAFASFDGAGNPITGSRSGAGPVARAAGDPVSAGSVFNATYQFPATAQPVSFVNVATSAAGVAQVSAAQLAQAVDPAGDQPPGVSQAYTGPVTNLKVGASVSVPVTVSASSTISKMEYYLNGLEVGSSTAPPFGFSFAPPAAGTYVLTTISTDAAGFSSVSAPITVQTVPGVSLVLRGDGLAITGVENGKVRISRTGDLSAALTVFYKVKGAAVNGVDYQTLTGSAVIPAGSAGVKVKVLPLANPSRTSPLPVKIVLAADPNGNYAVGTAYKAKIEVQ